MAESDAHNVKQDLKIEHLEERVDRIENLAVTLAENQQTAQNELVTEAWRGIRKGAPILLAVLLAALGLGNQTGVM